MGIDGRVPAAPAGDGGLGGIFTMAILVLPSARKALTEQYPKLLSELTARLQRVGWFSLLVLFGTACFR